MKTQTANRPEHTPAAARRKTGQVKTALRKSGYIGLRLGIVPAVALMLVQLLLLVMFAYRTQTEQIQYEKEFALFLLLAALFLGSSLTFLYIRAERYCRVIRSLEANLDMFRTEQDAAAALNLLETFPVGVRMPNIGYGWNALVAAVDELRDRLEIAQIGSGMNQFLCSYDAQRLLGLLDSLPDGIVLTDNLGNVILVNRICEGMIGRRLSDFIGKSVTELFSDEKAKNDIKELLGQKSVRADKYFEISVSASGKDGPDDSAQAFDSSSAGAQTSSKQDTAHEKDTVLWVICRRQKEGPENGGLLLIIRDITQQKLRDVGREAFIAHVSHELRSPLTNIRAYAETLLSDMMLDAQAQKEAYNVINEETSRLIRMVNDVLDLSRMESGSLSLEKDEVFMDRLVRQCVNDVKALAGSKKITLQANYHPKLPNLYADREKLSVVMNNILSNALKYTPVGGTVFVETNADDRYLYLKVVDTGFGVGAEDIDKIFDKFYRVDREEVAEVEGTGLGLALSKEIVNLHGGTINVSSELNKGTEVMVKLPLTASGPVLGPTLRQKAE